MNLPPLANVVAVHAEDPELLKRARERIEGRSGFDTPFSPAPGWIVAVARLPASEPDPAAARAAGLVFAEGRLDVQAHLHWEPLARLAHDRPEQLDQVDGDVAFLAFHGKDVVGVRAPSGRVPLYVTTSDTGPRTFATTFEHLLLAHPAPLTRDPLIGAMYAGGEDAAVDRRTLVRGVAAVGRGEHVILRDGRLRFGRHWDPRRYGALEVAPDEHAEILRTSLLRTLGRELDRDGVNLLTMSGGVDSTAVGALAAGALGADVATVTTLQPRQHARREDQSYIDEVARHVGGFTRSTYLPVDGDERLRLLGVPDVPFHVLQLFIAVLPEVVAAHPHRVLLGGEFADHTVGSSITMRDWSRVTSPRALAGIALRGRLPHGRHDVKVWARHRAAILAGRPPIPWAPELPTMVRPELRAEYADWWHDRRRRAATDAHPMSFYEMWLERDGFLAMHWEVCSAIGLRRVYPFITREVLDLAFRVHPRELVGPGTKRLLRAAVRDLVPDRNLDRPDKAAHAPPADLLLRPWPGALPEDVLDVVDPAWSPGAQVQFWDLFRVRQLVAFAQSFERARTAMPRTLATETR